jgi:beta-glucosidase
MITEQISVQFRKGKAYLKRPVFVRLVFVLFSVLVAVTQSLAQTVPTYKNTKAPLESRVNDLFSRMTQDEKLGFLTGTGFTTQPLPRLGVPPMAMADAGEGVRGGQDSTQGAATQFPAGVMMASSWDPLLVGQVANAIGEEARGKGTSIQVMLGPAVNIQRSPLGGRSSEYFSEDPFLAGRLAVGYIEGMQSTGCGACIKHYACNNEETDRFSVNVNVDERALREIYLPAFEAGVTEGHAWSAMASYNKIGGYYATANHYLLIDVLRDDWGWDGLVMSDWGAVHVR